MVSALGMHQNGLSSKNYGDYENVYDAYYRIKANDKFNELSRKELDDSRDYMASLSHLMPGLEHLDQTQRKVPSFVSMEWKTIQAMQDAEIKQVRTEEFMTRRAGIIRSNLKYLIQGAKRKSFERNRFIDIIKRIESHFIETRENYPYERNQSKFWRAFSKYIRKPGINLYSACAILNMVIMIYLFFFYAAMESSIDKTAILKLESFPGYMIILLFVQVAILCLERWIYLKSPKSWRQWETFSQDQTEGPYLLHMFKFAGQEHRTPLQKFAKIARRAHMLLCLSPALTADKLYERCKEDTQILAEKEKRKNDPRQDYIANPM
jgi:hypothetical protein